MPAFKIGKNSLREIGRAMPAELDTICRNAAETIVTTARSSLGSGPGSAPNRPPGRVSGNLASGFYVAKVSEALYEAGNTMPHAHLMELGTRERKRHRGRTGRVARRPFLRPSVRSESKQFDTAITNAVKKTAR